MSHILALSGGVGGAKLCAGLADVLPPGRLTIAVNTGDDFEHLGLTICPDIDSVVYALAGLNDTARGWGVAEETWQAMAMLRRLGQPDWFNLGDRDMATHIARSHLLRQGLSLSAVTAQLVAALGIAHIVTPMSDAPVRTQVQTDVGWTDFQQWFVGQQCGPAVRSIRFAGLPAQPSQALAEALARPDLGAVVIAPSNPFVSVDPILALDGVRDALAARRVPVIAVSPLVGGQAIKGPLAKMLAEQGHARNNLSIADHYPGLIDHLLIDEADAGDAHDLRARGIAVTVSATVMRSAEDRRRLAREALSSAGIL